MFYDRGQTETLEVQMDIQRGKSSLR
ncbi:hypothetical protein QTP70_020843 [Hemibagrus guttatus]|uniref:Uncharacterized protein n=1 Tax=Hemibagrus guttatus TaxID=175788 RepID=A0AAE0REP3_9TELE|nr:hypothetical protein QTP70_020843 [Hemibagrus guttatus]